jgi:hypothetical protein
VGRNNAGSEYIGDGMDPAINTARRHKQCSTRSSVVFPLAGGQFCGVKALREATREQVENFVAHLADWAEKDRNALLCQLNSYLSSKEGAA